MLNTIHLIGRLGADPEMRETPNGYKYARFSLPLFHGFNNQDAKASWVQCEAWNKLGEIVMSQKKGSQVYIEGELVIDTWEARNEKTGEMERRSRPYVRVRGIRFLERANAGANVSASASTSAPQQNRPLVGASSAPASASAAPAVAATPAVHNHEDLPDLDMPSIDDGIGAGSMDDLFGNFSYEE
jgi:single-strand DNA-binding protein